MAVPSVLLGGWMGTVMVQVLVTPLLCFLLIVNFLLLLSLCVCVCV